MHELSVAMSLIDGVEEARGGSRVRVVYVRLGSLSGVVKEALAPAFEMACSGTELEGAELRIEDAEGRELELTALEVE
jgi:hydrogenase nickel incorporation protein HypA/HybF